MTINVTAVIVTAMACVAVIECVALYLGHNGAILATVIGAFCMIIGAGAKTIQAKTQNP